MSVGLGGHCIKFYELDILNLIRPCMCCQGTFSSVSCSMSVQSSLKSTWESQMIAQWLLRLPVKTLGDCLKNYHINQTHYFSSIQSQKSVKLCWTLKYVFTQNEDCDFVPSPLTSASQNHRKGLQYVQDVCTITETNNAFNLQRCM